MLLVHVVERLGRIAKVPGEVVLLDADHAGVLTFDEDVVERPFGELHDDDEFAVDVVDAFDGADERMADLLDALQGAEFLLGPDAVLVERVEVAVDELDGLVDAAGSFAFPDFAETARTQRFDQAVAGDRFGVLLPDPAHRS